MKKFNKKVIIVIVILIIIAIAVSTVCIIINKNKKREQEYNKLLVSVAKDIYKYEIEAEYHSNYISLIWYNSIFKKRNPTTDKYAFPEDEYGYGVNMWVNFDKAIRSYLSDNEEKLANLNNMQKELGIKLNSLQDMPNNKYQDSLELLTSMYSNFASMVSLANSPSGTYQEYGEKCNKYAELFESEYNKLLVKYPDIETELNNIINNAIENIIQ